MMTNFGSSFLVRKSHNLCQPAIVVLHAQCEYGEDTMLMITTLAQPSQHQLQHRRRRLPSHTRPVLSSTSVFIIIVIIANIIHTIIIIIHITQFQIYPPGTQWRFPSLAKPFASQVLCKIIKIIIRRMTTNYHNCLCVQASWVWTFPHQWDQSGSLVMFSLDLTTQVPTFSN